MRPYREMLMAHLTHDPQVAALIECFSPFFLIIIVVLLLVWRLIVYPGLTPVKYSKCPEGSTRVTVVAGDTCWRIGEAHGCGLDGLREVNANLVCERLLPGDQICVPSVLDGDVYGK